MHVHVASTDGIAKFWLEPLIALELHYNLKSKQLSDIQAIIEEHADEFKAAWRRHFGQ